MDVTRIALADKWRDKISKANILDRLLKDFRNKLRVPLTASQITLGLKLIGKILPDLQSATLDIRIEHAGMNRLELEARAHVLGINPNELWHSIDDQSVIEHDKVIVIQEDTSES